MHDNDRLKHLYFRTEGVPPNSWDRAVIKWYQVTKSPVLGSENLYPPPLPQITCNYCRTEPESGVVLVIKNFSCCYFVKPNLKVLVLWYLLYLYLLETWSKGAFKACIGKGNEVHHYFHKTRDSFFFICTLRWKRRDKCNGRVKKA
jgi:hypothetical protein